MTSPIGPDVPIGGGPEEQKSETASAARGPSAARGRPAAGPAGGRVGGGALGALGAVLSTATRAAMDLPT